MIPPRVAAFLALNTCGVLVAGQTCSGSTTVTSCLKGYQGPATALAAIGGSAPVSTPSTGYCVRYTIDCWAAITLVNPNLNLNNCPAGQPFTVYTSYADANMCNMQQQLLQLGNPQNFTVCGGTSDCNSLIPPLANWTLASTGVAPCPAPPATPVTSCYVGVIGPNSGSGSAPVVRPTPAGRPAACYTGIVDCSTLTVPQQTGYGACNPGQTLTSYSYVNLDDASCYRSQRWGPNAAFKTVNVCTTNNCNVPSQSASGSAKLAPFFMTALAVMVSSILL